MKYITKLLKTLFFILLFCSSHAFSDTLNKIEIIGNDRISDETIKLFISLDIKDEINDDKLNNIINSVRTLYQKCKSDDILMNVFNQFITTEMPRLIEKSLENKIKCSIY